MELDKMRRTISSLQEELKTKQIELGQRNLALENQKVWSAKVFFSVHWLIIPQIDFEKQLFDMTRLRDGDNKELKIKVCYVRKSGMVWYGMVLILIIYLI